MIYNFGFKIHGEIQTFENKKYLAISSDYIPLLRELLGKYPSSLDCYPMDKLQPILEGALQKLNKYYDELGERYSFRSGKQLETAKFFLGELYKRCLALPESLIEVDW